MDVKRHISCCDFMFCALFIIFMTKTNSMKTIYLKYHNEMIEKSPAFRNYARGN